jgi:hypothetical protein
MTSQDKHYVFVCVCERERKTEGHGGSKVVFRARPKWSEEEGPGLSHPSNM